MNIKKIKRPLSYISFLTIFMFISAVTYNLLIRPINLVAGGTGGIAIVFEKLLGVNPAKSILIMYLILLIFSLIFLKKKDTMSALLIAFIYPLFVNLTENIGNIINLDYSNMLLVTIFGGTIGGITNGFIYKYNLNPGGLGIICKIAYRKYRVSVTTTSFILNIIVVVAGAFVFGFNMLLYAGVYLFLTKVISDKIILGISSNKVFHVVSDKTAQIRNILFQELKHDCTIYDVKDNKKKMLMVVVPSKDYYVVKALIKKIDNEAFSFISDGYEVKGADKRIKVLSS